MKSKNLALTNGIVGLVGGIILIFGPMLMLGSAMNDVESGTANTAGVTIFLNIVKLAILILGITAIVFYRSTELVKTAAHVLLIVGGAVALIPFLGWAGGILAIIGGALYLTSLKNFKQANS
ncbi:hypothetical protein [Agrilactobacillus composti]|uniref:hypothetical protein n=1 Tax=Agrilactobacillus composti TaxID=398555 RepID=UPI00054F9B00|nr:hypothetical protein [Agrilactobacillus composti]